jgi:ergothioneine biosynthesis protein EgtB
MGAFFAYPRGSMASPTRVPMPLQPLLQRLADARANTDALFEKVAPKALYDRPIPERHRLIFYLGHLEAFDWNLLGRGAFDLAADNPELDKLFAFGIDPVGGNLPSDLPSDWPKERAVRKYVSEVRETLDQSLANAFFRSRQPSAQIGGGTLLQVAIEHRLMHAETLAYLLHQLPYESKLADKRFSAARPIGVERSGTVRIPAGHATLGIRRHPDGVPGHSADAATPFGWDNEFEATTEKVPAFGIGAYPVTNGEFLEFVRASGYTDRSAWSDEDWAWKSEQGLEYPFLWVQGRDGWNYRGMFEEYPLPLNAPVYVSYAEASAYARWSGKSLPTEAQWHRAAYGTREGNELDYPWGDELPDPSRGNFDFVAWDPAPASSHPFGASRFGVHDLLGNGWEWTSTLFAPLPGFEPFPFYRGYSADFFDGKHFVMKGGSPRTAACMLRRSFRNWFQPHYPYVYAKFRCVEE